MKKTLTFLMIILSVGSINAQFEICNSGTDKTLHDVYFINENIGIAVGDSGTIIRSIDGGLNWVQIMEIDSIQFKKVKFWDENNGIVLGSTNMFITINSGESWNNITNSMNNTFYDIELIGNDKAIVSGDMGNIYKYSDFGQNIELLYEDTTGVIFNHLSFIDESIGYANFQDGASTKLYKTLDGGNNWFKIESSTTDSFTLIEDIEFLSEDIGFRGGWYNPHLQNTINGGMNWNQSSNSIGGFWSSIYDFHIENEQPNSFYACGWYGEIFRSIDFGLNWETIETPISTLISLRGIYFISDAVGWVVGDKGTILKTTNSGGLTSAQNTFHQTLKLFPNPIENKLQIDGLSSNEIESITIFNLAGHQLIKLRPVNELSLENILPGIYIIEIITIKDRYVKKIVKL